jgi:hypothetical protein
MISNPYVKFFFCLLAKNQIKNAKKSKVDTHEKKRMLPKTWLILPRNVEWTTVDCTLDEFAKVKVEILKPYPIDLIEPIPPAFRMTKGDTNCSSCALFAYNGVEDAPKELTIVELMNFMNKSKKQRKTKMYVKPNECVSHSAMFINASDRYTPCLVYFQDMTANEPMYPQPNEWFTEKTYIVLTHPIFYPDKHCLVIIPPHVDLPDVWCLRDPFRKDGSGVCINETQLSLLYAYASLIFW